MDATTPQDSILVSSSSSTRLHAHLRQRTCFQTLRTAVPADHSTSGSPHADFLLILPGVSVRNPRYPGLCTFLVQHPVKAVKLVRRLAHRDDTIIVPGKPIGAHSSSWARYSCDLSSVSIMSHANARSISCKICENERTDVQDA
jgi:hypothetical protein